MKQPVEEQTDRTVKILEGKIREIIEKEGKQATNEAMWHGAFDLLKESLDTSGAYVDESLKIASKYAPEQLNERANEVREYLSKLAHLTNEQKWKEKDFYQLMLKTVFTPEAYTDSDLVDKVIDLCTSTSPKIRKRALPVLRRVIEHENTAAQESKTFNKIVAKVEALSASNVEYSGKIISILGQLQQEIAKYGATERMLEIARAIQEASPKMSIPAITFSEFLLAANPAQYLDKHIFLAEASAHKGCTTAEELSILIKYLIAIFKNSSVHSFQTGAEFVLDAEGSPLEQMVKDVLKAEMDRSLPNKIDAEVYAVVHELVSTLKSRMFPGFKKVIVLLAQYCFKENDLRVAKDIEIIIGSIGVDKFMKTIKEKEFYFWLPMIKAAVHSTDIEVFVRRFVPEIQALKNAEDKKEIYEALWSCFPSFCRGMKDSSGLLKSLIQQIPLYLNNPAVRGYICQGLSVLVEESQREMVAHPESVPFRTGILKTLSSAVDIFEKILFRFKKDQTENEREAIRSLSKVVDPEWQNKYYSNIINTAFVTVGELHTGELRPNLERKETDVPEPERIFIDNAPVLEVIAGALVGNSTVTEGTLRYIVSTHLRTQKMAYKVLLALVQAGFVSNSLVDFFMDPRTDQVLFHCSRHLRLQVLHTLIKQCGVNDDAVICRLIFEVIRAVRTEGGRNRKVSFDIVNEMAVTYPADKLNAVCKMAAAGIPGGLVDYQAGAIVTLTSFMYHGREKISEEVMDMAFDMMESLSADKKYAVAKASIGLMSTLLIELDQLDKYMERALICVDRIIFHFKMKLHENLKLLLRKIAEKRGTCDFSHPQKTLLNHRPVNRQEERERIVTDRDGKMRIKEQSIVDAPRRKKVRRD
ncbi:ribosomal RNA-processing protein 12 [Nematocida minor]|uniref:ribosomal RNA-processing protein 12 n=1 Tax=Nematocida minor TaxID=1912983 RepID=UPI00221F8A79|nr:ribosomal RNA-processing protein 12 [Nematocida minor]KAI5190220.1 ribosomal RNA-processing protein 12 [Nematocida minor]